MIAGSTAPSVLAERDHRPVPGEHPRLRQGRADHHLVLLATFLHSCLAHHTLCEWVNARGHCSDSELEDRASSAGGLPRQHPETSSLMQEGNESDSPPRAELWLLGVTSWTVCWHWSEPSGVHQLLYLLGLA